MVKINVSKFITEIITQGIKYELKLKSLFDSKNVINNPISNPVIVLISENICKIVDDILGAIS